MIARGVARCSAQIAHQPLSQPRPRLRPRPQLLCHSPPRTAQRLESFSSSCARSPCGSCRPEIRQQCCIRSRYRGASRRISTSVKPATAPSSQPLQATIAGLSTTAAAAAATAATAATLLAPFIDELDRIAPCFRIHGSQVEILETPAEFYEKLKSMIRGAERRIFLSTLYIGKSEKELIATLQETLRAKPHVTLHILTDALRGTREAPEPSCASLLAPLVAEFGPDRVDLRMYHTPNLTGLRKRLVPRRINEGWGLQHMKLYGADDQVLLSGANLSTDYFTNRQDRYHLFSSPELTDFYWRLHSRVASLSFQIEPSAEAAVDGSKPGFAMVWPTSNPAPSPLDAPKAFVAYATDYLRGLMGPQAATPNKESSNSQITTTGASSPAPPDTSVYVLAQLTQLLRPDCSTERPALIAVLRTLARRQEYAGASWTFTAGYFNPAPFLTKLLLATASASSSQTGTVITASPYANGFYKSPGVSGLLPDAYSFLASRFLRTVHRQQGDDMTITLKEWQRGVVGQPGGWTYHAKGLWITLPRQQNPALTLVGSSNYTKRSYALDLEANALVVTQNPDLQRRLGEEQQWLQRHAAPMTRDDFARPERRVRLHVRVAMWIVQVLGGAL